MNTNEEHLVTVGFFLGLHVADMVLQGHMQTRMPEVVDCLDAVRCGDTTLLESIADIERMFPKATNVGEARHCNEQELQQAAAIIMAPFLRISGK